MHMDGLGLWHLILMLVYLAIIVVPCWRIVGKAGYAGAWSLLALIPVVNLVALWVFAFMRWPNEQSRGTTIVP